MEGKFVKNKRYYRDTVYEWNLPTGSTYPFALECKVTVDRITGKFDVYKGQYKCYAAAPERFPAVVNIDGETLNTVKMAAFLLFQKIVKQLEFIVLAIFSIKSILICGYN
jgi:hypothetical protein